MFDEVVNNSEFSFEYSYRFSPNMEKQIEIEKGNLVIKVKSVINEA